MHVLLMMLLLFLLLLLLLLLLFSFILYFLTHGVGFCSVCQCMLNSVHIFVIVPSISFKQVIRLWICRKLCSICLFFLGRNGLQNGRNMKT